MKLLKSFGVGCFASLLSISLPALANKNSETDLRTQVKSRITQFADAFPDIAFLHVKSPEDAAIVRDLQTYLGPAVRDMAYEHDDEVRQLLVEAQLDRILLMTGNNWPSSTLFRTGKNNAFNKPYVCVVTLALTPFEANPQHASQMLLGSTDPLSFPVLPTARLNNEAFVRFTLDHELFHCLDAYLNGPTIKKSKTEVGHCYQLFRAEQRADLFAALSFRQQQAVPNSFLDKLHQYRTLALLDWDTAHFTTHALRNAQTVTLSRIENIDVIGLAKLTHQLAGTAIPSESEFGLFLGAAQEVALNRGVEAAASADEASELKLQKRDPRQVARLDERLSQAQHKVFGHPGPAR